MAELKTKEKRRQCRKNSWAGVADETRRQDAIAVCAR